MGIEKFGQNRLIKKPRDDSDIGDVVNAKAAVSVLLRIRNIKLMVYFENRK